VRQIRLCDVAGDRDLGTVTEAREEHAHLLAGRVLSLVQDHESVVQGAAAHERERRHLYLPALLELLGALVLEHVVERVVQRAQVGVDLLGQITGQKSELLARFHRGTHEHDSLHLFLDQERGGHRHRQVGLAGARGADAESQVVRAHGFDVSALTLRFRQHRLLSRGDQNRFVEQLGQAAVRIGAQTTEGSGHVVRRDGETAADELDRIGQEAERQPHDLFFTREIDGVAAQADVGAALLGDLGQ
jgi:hypothetical protein